jgi:hypothetical protein
VPHGIPDEVVERAAGQRCVERCAKVGVCLGPEQHVALRRGVVVPGYGSVEHTQHVDGLPSRDLSSFVVLR